MDITVFVTQSIDESSREAWWSRVATLVRYRMGPRFRIMLVSSNELSITCGDAPNPGPIVFLHA